MHDASSVLGVRAAFAAGVPGAADDQSARPAGLELGPTAWLAASAPPSWISAPLRLAPASGNAGRSDPRTVCQAECPCGTERISAGDRALPQGGRRESLRLVGSRRRGRPSGHQRHAVPVAGSEDARCAARAARRWQHPRAAQPSASKADSGACAELERWVRAADKRSAFGRGEGTWFEHYVAACRTSYECASSEAQGTNTARFFRRGLQLR